MKILDSSIWFANKSDIWKIQSLKHKLILKEKKDIKKPKRMSIIWAIIARWWTWTKCRKILDYAFKETCQWILWGGKGMKKLHESKISNFEELAHYLNPNQEISPKSLKHVISKLWLVIVDPFIATRHEELIYIYQVIYK